MTAVPVPISMPQNILCNFPAEVDLQRCKQVVPSEDLTAKQRVAMLERVRFCQDVYAILQSNHSTKQAEAVAIAATRPDQYPVLTAQGKKGASALTLRNYREWMSRLGKLNDGQPNWTNAIALADRYTTTAKPVNGSPQFWTLFNGFYLNANKLSVSESYRLACQCIRKSGSPEKLPSERSIRYWLENHADTAAIQSSRRGSVWAENHVQGYIRRDWSAVKPNDIWFGDHHVFDVMIRVFDEKTQQWRASRPWLTAWMDASSLAMIGICIRAEDPNHIAILTALQNGIRTAGNVPPSHIYIDNGKDFLKSGVGEPFIPANSDQAHSVCNELGIKTIKAKPYNARAKTIERIFKECCNGFSKRWPQYLGNRPDARPEVAGFFQHKDNVHVLPSLHQFSECFLSWLDTEYHQRPSHGKILEGDTPASLWNARIPKAGFSDQQLWFGCLVPYTENLPTVQRGAAIVIDKIEYRSDALWPYFKKKIMVKRDVVNGHTPQAFTLDGKWICELERIESIPALISSDEDRKRLSNEIKRSKSDLKRAFGVADQLSSGLRKLAPQETIQIHPNEEVKIIKLGERSSIKGNDHLFSLHTLNRELSRGEEKNLAIEAFDRVINPPDESPEISSPASMLDFHSFISQRKNADDDI